MPESTATVGYGSQISWSATQAGSYVNVAQSRDLKSPESELGKINITNNDSPSNTKEYVGGMIEPGEQTFEYVYTKAQQATLYGMWGAGVIYWWKETYPDGSTWAWPAFLTKVTTEGETEEKEIIGNVTMQLTGKPVFAAGS